MEAIEVWAATHKIEAFLPKLIEAGFDTIEVLSELDAGDLDWMEITKPGDRKKILLAVKQLPCSDTFQEEEDDIIDIVHDPTLELVHQEYSREMTQGRTSVLQMTDMLQALSPLLSHGHRINEGNPLYSAICKGDRQEVVRLVSKMKEGRINIDINELCGETKTTALHTAVGMGGKILEYYNDFK